MKPFDHRPSNRMLQQIAVLERLRGRAEHLGLSACAQALAAGNGQAKLIKNDAKLAALRLQAAASVLLDSSSPAAAVHTARQVAVLRSESLRAGEGAESFEDYCLAHELPCEFDTHSLDAIVAATCKTDPNGVAGLSIVGGPASLQFDVHRSQNASFVARGTEDHDEIVFATVPGFLVEQRLAELLDWLQRELEAGDYHPLIVIGTFHLLFLQVFPYRTGNHRLALLLMWRLLGDQGFGFLQLGSPSKGLLARNKQYIHTLRQAEKTVNGTWQTLSGWLELFYEVLIEASSAAVVGSEQQFRELRLTRTQQNIIEIVKTHGSATRETIVTESGINLSTVKYNLSVLSAKGHLRRYGGGRTTSYSVT
jgi:hypothetical protein